ncbi:MAG: hypothetical protein ABIG80_01320, partial [Patescibacteria group bacterium]
MGDPKKSPWDSSPEEPTSRSPWGRRPQTATENKPETGRQPEKKEVPKGQKGGALDDYRKKAEKLSSDPNVKAAEAIRELQGNKETVAQLDGLTALNTAIVSVLTKLAKKGVDVSKIRTAEDLQHEILKNGLTLTLPEATAVENLNRIAGQPGPTATEVKNSWPDRVQTAQEAGKGWSDKYKEYLQKNPVGTIALTVAGAAGIYLTYQGIKSLVKMAFASEDTDKSKEKGGSWFKKGIMIPLILLAAGAFLGKDVVKKICKDAGLDWFDVEDKLRRGEELTDDQKRKAENAAKKIQDEIDARRKGAAGGAAAGAAAGPEAAEEHEEPAPVPGALEVEGAELREYGEKLLKENGAEKLEDGAFLITTETGRKVFYKFDTDAKKWLWQSETQKKDEEWSDCEESPYDEKACPDAVKANEIARRLAGVTALPEKGGENSEVHKKGAEALEAGRYTAAKKALLAIYFNPRFHKPEVFDLTIDNVSQDKFAEIKALVNKHKDSKRIPKSEFPSTIKSGISEEYLFLLFEKMVSFSKLGHAEDENMTVQVMLESVMRNPLADQLEGINTAVINALKQGDIGDALKTIAVQGIENIQSKAVQMTERLNQVLDINVENLNKEEKIVFREMQGLLLTNPTLVKRDPKDVIDNILKTNSKFKEQPKAVELATKFFAEVKKRSPAILEKVIRKFEIKKEDLPNYLREGVSMDNLLFFNACELVLLDQAIESEGDQATDLLILGVLIRSIREPRLKEPYIGLISDEVTKDIPSVNIPCLKSLQPYFEKALRVAGAHLGYKALDFMHRWSPYQTEHPTAKSHEAMAEDFKNQNIVFGSLKESGGTTLELSSDALAAIVLALPGVQDELASCETGQEFLQLIRVNGGHVTAYKDRDGVMGILIDTGYEVFLARPGAIVWEAAKSAAELSWGGAWDAAKIWVGGSSFFVTAGGIRGIFKAYRPKEGGRVLYSITTRTVNAFKGMWWGLKYPIKAPIFTYDVATHTVKGLATGAEGLSSMAKAPLRGGRRALNWTRDVLRYGIPGQNVENMVDTGRLLEKHFKLAEIKGDVPTKAGIRARAGRFLRRGKELLQKPIATLRQMTAGDWHWGMAKKFAERYASQYNDLFGLDENTGFKLDELNTHGKVQNVTKANERLNRFLQKTQDDPKLLEKIVEAAKNNKDKTLQKKILDILKDTGLNENEMEALARRINSEGMAKKVTEQISRASKRMTDSAAVKAAKPSALQAISEGVPRKPVRILGKEPKYQYGGEVIELTKNEISAMQKAKNLSPEEAIAALCEEKWLAKHPEVATAAEKPTGGAECARARLRRGLQHLTGETLASAGGAEKVLQAVGKDLKDIQEKVARAEKTLQGIEDARKAGEAVGDMKKIEDQIAKARQVIADGQRAEAELHATARAIQEAKNAKDALDAAKKAKDTAANLSKLEKELRTATTAAEEAMKSSGTAMESLSKLGKFVRPLKIAGRVAGATFAVGGAAYSGYEAIISAHEAVTTDVAGRGKVKGLEAGMWTVNAVADGAAVAVLFGAESAAVGYAGAAALPLAPLTYAGATVFETKYEETKTDYEWAQEAGGNPYAILHHFYTSINSISLGDAWIGAGKAIGRSPAYGTMALLFPAAPAIASYIDGDFSFETKGQKEAWDKNYAESVENKVDTMRKIYRGLIAIQKDPSILNLIQDTKMDPKEKSREIERRIAAAYTINHEYYFRNMSLTGMQSYGSAQKFILEAQMFDDIMQMRDKAKRAGMPFPIIGNDKLPFNMELDRYDIVGGIENPKGRVDYIPAHVVQAYKETLIRNFEKDPIRKGNLDRMDTAYLIRLYMQTAMALEDELMKEQIDKEPELRETFEKQIMLISGYLKTARSVNMLFAMQDPAYREPRMTLETIVTHLEGIGAYGNKTYLEFEKENYEMTPALQALYRLGEYFGYNGPPSEERLKIFFSESGADYHGLYWDGSQWYLRERGYELDDAYGAALTTHMIDGIIKRMREQPDNILKHRSDAIFLDAYDYTAEVNKMAGILENGLAEGTKRGYERSATELRQEVVAPPKKFDPKKIDYSQEKEPLMADFGKAIEHVKS